MKPDAVTAFFTVAIAVRESIVFFFSIVSNNLNPEWHEVYHLDVCHYANELAFEVRDKDHTYAEFIGSVIFSTADLSRGEVMEGLFPIRGKQGAGMGELRLKIQVQYTYTLRVALNTTLKQSLVVDVA